ncbi:MAG TPA: type II toxin-antitoxin system VapC family toxin [Chloroflexia bacterium]|nr:type II toxin-antitoxin system VapC family toxin [Chloroflexia bacterium]
MRLLLDTHTFLWFISGDRRLSNEARVLIENTDNSRLLSVASLWEIAIKMSMGKLNLGLPFAEFVPQQLNRNLIDLIGITISQMDVVASLPFHHKDPFDRLLIAQAIVEQLPIISADMAFDNYGVNRLW